MAALKFESRAELRLGCGVSVGVAVAFPAIMAKKAPDLMERIVSLCKRRGFVFQSSDIYGGFSSCYDYGPLGVELKRNVKDAWWQSMVTGRDDIVGLDSAIIQHPDVWKSSGHLEGFHDMMVDCKECKGRFREDHLEDPNKCPNCGAEGSFTEARAFNLMFKTFAGPVESTASTVYLRPETAQGIFTNFMNVVNSSRVKPPFGIAQIGKSFRNEITPGNFVFRTREFEQMEMEFFIPPGEDDKWYEYWIQQRFDWYVENGVRPEKLRKRVHADDELGALLDRLHGRGVRVPVRLERAGRDREARLLRPDAARRRAAARTCRSSTRPTRSATCRTSSSRPLAVTARR